MDGTTMETPMTEPFALSSQMLGALPIVDCFLSRMRVDTLLARWLPAADARVALEPAKAIGLLVRNLCVSREPIYALGEWAAPFDPALLGMTADDVALLNDGECPRICVGVTERTRHVYEDHNASQQQDRVSAGLV